MIRIMGIIYLNTDVFFRNSFFVLHVKLIFPLKKRLFLNDKNTNLKIRLWENLK